MTLKIVVVGAGIAGLACACALRAEHEVYIIEQTRLKTETGAAIHLGPNASRLVLSWGCDLSESPHLNRVREENSQAELQSERAVDAVKDFGAPWLLNHRVTLHQELLRVATSSSGPGKAPVLMTGSRVESVDTENGVVHLEGGEQIQGDIIIGADGIKSQVRTSVLGNNFTAKPSGHSAYRGLIPMEKVMADTELSYLSSPTGLSIFLAKDRKLVIYSCRFQGQDYLNLVAAVPDHGMGETSQESWYEPGKVEDLMASFADFHPKLVRLLSYVKECGLWQLRDQDPLDTWVKERAILVGDAAHPMLPHLGQGGSQAIEDADMLAYTLSGLSHEHSSAEDINAALERTFRLRYERATVCQERSREQAFGKREVILANGSSNSIPALNPMQFAGYTFTYKGAKDWAESHEESGQVASSSPSNVVPKVDVKDPYFGSAATAAS